MAPQEKPNSLLAFLRAIRFKRKSDKNSEKPSRSFAGLSSGGQRGATDEAGFIRSAN
jgi:hypothetical protein